MRDYDKFKCGRIPVTAFRRALDLAGLGLTTKEVVLLEERSGRVPDVVGRGWVPDVVGRGWAPDVVTEGGFTLELLTF